MLSRVADNLYWMSRYLERAEHTARLIDVNLNLMLDESTSSADRRWRRVLAALGNPPNLAWSGDAYQVAQILTFDPAKRVRLSPPASCRPAKTRARCAKKSAPISGSGSTVSIMQVTRYKPNETEDVLPSDFLLAVIEGVHLFRGRHRFDHESWRGLAFHSGGTLHRARLRHGHAAGSLSPRVLGTSRPRPRRQRVSGMDWLAALAAPLSKHTARSTPPTSVRIGSSNFFC